MSLCTRYLHVHSVCFQQEEGKKNKMKFQKKKVFIYALHFFVSLTFCTYLKRLTSVSGLTEPFSRSAKILYSMYMYFYSYAYKYMSVICHLCPVFFFSFQRPHGPQMFWNVCASDLKWKCSLSLWTRPKKRGKKKIQLFANVRPPAYSFIKRKNNYLSHSLKKKSGHFITFYSRCCFKRASPFGLALVNATIHKSWIDVPLETFL